MPRPQEGHFRLLVSLVEWRKALPAVSMEHSGRELSLLALVGTEVALRASGLPIEGALIMPLSSPARLRPSWLLSWNGWEMRLQRCLSLNTYRGLTVLERFAF